MVFDNVKVGDKFRNKMNHTILTVTELTERGFKYTCTEHHVFPARFGPSLVKEGELYNRDHPQVSWDQMYSKLE